LKHGLLGQVGTYSIYFLVSIVSRRVQY